jgi:hypothetical protein
MFIQSSFQALGIVALSTGNKQIISALVQKPYNPWIIIA